MAPSNWMLPLIFFVTVKVLKDEEKERARRIEESSDSSSETQKERMRTYDKLVNVQEDLLRHMRKLQVYIFIVEPYMVVCNVICTI